MTEIEKQRYERDWKERLAKQQPHPVHQPLEVLWDRGWDTTGCWMRRVTRIAVDESDMTALRFHQEMHEARVSWEQLKQWEALRRSWIARMANDPFQFGWISEYFRPILIGLCKKRLANPGKVIEFLQTGGNRPGKTKTLLHLVVCNYIHNVRPPGFEKRVEGATDEWKAQVMVLHETEPMSRKWHHPVVFEHLPRALKAQARKRSTTETNFHYNAKGFVGESFEIAVDVVDDEGRETTGGGLFEFRNYRQDEDSFQGGEYNTILSDELIPPQMVTTLNARLASRVELTREEWFLARIRKLLQLLEDNTPFDLIHRSLLGVVLQGVHVISFTPIKGYTATVKLFLAGARRYGKVEAPVLKTLAGAKSTLVPRYAQPIDPLRWVAFLPTSANIFKPAYHAIMGGARSGGEKLLRMKLYGDVDQDQQSEFAAAYDPDIHLCDWKHLPRTGTIYEVFDPAGAKPWAMGWYLVDELERVWMLQEWPCESIEINGSLPGPWAVVSMADRLNGDEGPAYELRLAWGISRWCRQIWEGRARILHMMAATGEAWRGAVEKRRLFDGGKAAGDERAFIGVERSIIDSRFAGSKIDNPKGGEQVTVLERLFDDANAILCEPAEGVALDEGNLLIADKLAERVLGDQAALKINRECTNTQFMLTNYTLPPHRDTTARKDEACKEWRDLLAYLLLSRPVWCGNSGKVERGGCY